MGPPGRGEASTRQRITRITSWTTVTFVGTKFDCTGLVSAASLSRSVSAPRSSCLLTCGLPLPACFPLCLPYHPLDIRPSLSPTPGQHERRRDRR